MPVFVGSTQIFTPNIKLGGNEIAEIYYGSVKIYPVTDPPPPEAIVTLQPQDTTATWGDFVDFTCAFSYSGESLTYQWQRFVVGGSEWQDVAGQTTTTRTVEATENNNGVQFRCVATDELNRVTITNAATLTTEPPVSGSQTFDNSGTFTVPAGVTEVRVTATAGGGGGGGGASSGISGASGVVRYFVDGGGGGAAGEQVISKVYSVTPGENISVTIGGSGAGGIGPGGSDGFGRGGGVGSSGGDTVIGAPISLTLRGGQGGAGGTVQSSGNSNGYAWTVRRPGGAGYSQGATDGANAGGSSGNGSGTNSSQRNTGTDDVQQSSTPASGRAGGSWQDTAVVTTGLGGGNGGSTVFGVGGKGGNGAYGNGLNGSNPSGRGAGGAGGGGGASLDYLYKEGGNGSAGSAGRVVFDWG